MDYSPSQECLKVQVLLSRRKWATIHNIYAPPIRPAGVTITLDAARLPMGNMNFVGSDRFGHSPMWDTNQPSEPW